MERAEWVPIEKPIAVFFPYEEEPASFVPNNEAESEWAGSEYMTIVESDIPPYEGSYDVTPSLADILLETSGKRMVGNLTVREIPRYDVSNEFGTTVSIG